jgi:CRP-like cAMP-binding protein
VVAAAGVRTGDAPTRSPGIDRELYGKLIDRIRHDIQERLDQLLAEVEKLRHALALLDPRERRASDPKPAGSTPKPASKPAAKRTVDVTKPTSTSSQTSAVSSANGPATTRTPPGETRAKVLAALSSGTALTAADVAKATGLVRPTVSTTLSRLAKSGEVAKADRGYRLPTTSNPSEPAIEGS